MYELTFKSSKSLDLSPRLEIKSFISNLVLMDVEGGKVFARTVFMFSAERALNSARSNLAVLY
jgi:hypothetical protein